ncbi:MAG: hypothetical protein ACXADX_19435, partial [Candidatus Hodarchaeales archaeon]
QRDDIFAIDTVCGIKVIFLEERKSMQEPERMKGWVHLHPGSRPNRATLIIETREKYNANDLADQAIELIDEIQS